jgi:hypothetical protein
VSYPAREREMKRYRELYHVSCPAREREMKRHRELYHVSYPARERDEEIQRVVSCELSSQRKRERVSLAPYIISPQLVPHAQHPEPAVASTALLHLA